jgi:hypothetical protein
VPRDFPDDDILQPLQTKAQSAASVAATAVLGAISSAATAVPSAISKVESAAKAAATAILNTNEIKRTISRNFSLGIKQFCVGFSNRTECKEPTTLPRFYPALEADLLASTSSLRPHKKLRLLLNTTTPQEASLASQHYAHFSTLPTTYFSLPRRLLHSFYFFHSLMFPDRMNQPLEL